MNNKEQIEVMFNAVLQTSRKLEESYNLLKKKFSELEIRLENNRRYLENILQSINTGVCSIDLNCKITTFNKEACSIFEVKEDDVRKRKLEQILDLNKDNVFELIDEYKEEKDIDILIGSKHKKISLSASPVTDNDKIVGAVIIFSDITKIEELKTENRRKEKLAVIGQMAASIAHDIKNPLASMELLVPLLSDDGKKDIADNIMISIKRINNIINNTLLFTKTIIYKPEHINTKELLKDIEFEVYAHLKAKNIKFTKNIEDFSLVNDKNLLKSAIVNLIVNALDAAKSEVAFNIYKSKSKSVFEVGDDGKGIDKKSLEHIFEPFYTSKKNGTGLGLSIVSKAVKAIDGKLVFKTNSKGTTFKIIV